MAGGVTTIESDYYAFMGFDTAHTREALSFYAPMFDGRGPVLELACGRGEFLDLLRDGGVEARGVDVDGGMVEATRARGHDVALGDALQFLAAADEGSYGGVFSAHFVEHLQPDDVLAMCRSAKRALRPGGRLVMATPYAAAQSIMGHDFWKDPTHVRFYDPALLRFFCAEAGFATQEDGVNPKNDPGCPPHLHALVPEGHAGLTDLINEGVLRSAAQRKLKEKDVKDDVAYVLGHLLNVVSERLRETEAALLDVHRAHEALLRALWPGNEVYVVADA
jgi:SAM-dependent methyltransferase